MFIRFMMYPPGTVLDETRDKMFQLVTFIAGIVSGWVLHGDPSTSVKDIKEAEEADAKKEADMRKKIEEEHK